MVRFCPSAFPSSVPSHPLLSGNLSAEMPSDASELLRMTWLISIQEIMTYSLFFSQQWKSNWIVPSFRLIRTKTGAVFTR